MKKALLLLFFAITSCFGQICEAPTGSRCWYFGPIAGSDGAGTFSNPFKLGDLPTSANCSAQDGALTNVVAGDYVYFRGGTYSLTNLCPNFSTAYIRPPVTGTLTKPIVFKSYPGEIANLVATDPPQPVIGSARSSGGLEYVQIIGFNIDLSSGSPSGGPCNCIRMGVTGGSDHGNVVAYNKCIGHPTVNDGENTDGIEIGGSIGAWVHHNEVTGWTQTAGVGNDVYCMKLYATTDSIVEDNYFHGCQNGLFDKNGAVANPVETGNILRRNYSVDNVGGNDIEISRSIAEVSDNVIKSGVILVACTGTGDDCNGTSIHNNLILPCVYCFTNSSVPGAVGVQNYTGTVPQQVRQLSIWNNIVLTAHPTVTTTGLAWGATWVTGSGSTNTVAYMDYNVYQATSDSPPLWYQLQYQIGPVFIKTMAQVRTGYVLEMHSGVDTTESIFVDSVNYILREPYRTGGRYGEGYGPRANIGQAFSDGIMNVARYGPSAIGVTPAPVISPLFQGNVQGRGAIGIK